MDEIYVTYVDVEHVDNHDYDDTTDDDRDNNNDIYGHISMIYRWSIYISMIYRWSIGALYSKIGRRALSGHYIGRSKTIVIPPETTGQDLLFGMSETWF